jgi:2,3-dihydroxybenzoate decarboxylase
VADKSGIELSNLSFYLPGIRAETDPDVAVQDAKRANDFLCKNVIARHPDRYAGFGAVRLQNSEAAAHALERYVKQLGFNGAMVNGYGHIQNEKTREYTDGGTIGGAPRAARQKPYDAY